MRFSRTLAVMAIAAVSMAAVPASADPGHGKGKARGIGFVAADRKHEGIIGDLIIAINLFIAFEQTAVG